MNPDEQTILNSLKPFESIAEVIVAVAELFQFEMTETSCAMYVAVIGRVPLDEFKLGVIRACRAKGVTRFPAPSVILDQIRPQQTRDDEAKDAASRIFAAIRKFGWSNRGSARAFIGELGWEVVERQGGWGHVCETMRDRDIPIYQAQFRELAKTVQVRALNNNLDQAPQLPRPTAQRPMLSAVVSELADAKQLKKGSGGA